MVVFSLTSAVETFVFPVNRSYLKRQHQMTLDATIYRTNLLYTGVFELYIVCDNDHSPKISCYMYVQHFSHIFSNFFRSSTETESLAPSSAARSWAWEMRLCLPWVMEDRRLDSYTQQAVQQRAHNNCMAIYEQWCDSLHTSLRVMNEECRCRMSF